MGETLLQARWLSLKAAAVYANIGRQRLKALARAGAVSGAPDPDSRRGDWIFDQRSLDAYREAQLGLDAVASKVAELRGRMFKP